MLVSITATAVVPEEIRITATNLEAILLEDDLFKKIDANEEKEGTDMTHHTIRAIYFQSKEPRT